MIARAPLRSILAAAALLALAIAPARAQSADESAPRAAPTTPVWTVAPGVNSQAPAQAQPPVPSQPTASQPRYAVMADAQPVQAAAPAAPQLRGRYSVSAPPADLPADQPVVARHANHGPLGDAYVLGTGDKLRVTVYGEADLSGEFEIGSSGEVRLPLIGQVQAGGLTVRAFEQRVAQQLAAGYLLNPRVSAEVSAYRPFFIIGEVNKPGQYPYVNAMNVVTAVALAGGYTYRADEDDVYVRRDGSTRENEVPADATTRIYPGDVIRVTERFF